MYVSPSPLSLFCRRRGDLDFSLSFLSVSLSHCLTLGETPPERERTPQGAAMRMEAIVLKVRGEKSGEGKSIRRKEKEGDKGSDRGGFFYLFFLFFFRSPSLFNFRSPRGRRPFS